METKNMTTYQYLRCEQCGEIVNTIDPSNDLMKPTYCQGCYEAALESEPASTCYNPASLDRTQLLRDFWRLNHRPAGGRTVLPESVRLIVLEGGRA
jgi:NAD-dependent SIR2 family protein deacetylase